MKKIMAGLAIAAALAGLGACSPDNADVQKSAEKFLESNKDVKDQTGTGFHDATCEKPAKLEVHEMFTCTATSDEDEEWTFGVEITKKDGNKVEFTVQSGQATGAQTGS